MLSNDKNFVISDENFREVLLEELHIANVAGIPFTIDSSSNNIKLYPKIGVNLDELCKSASSEIIELLKEY
jgi:hypothetical protein